ncbi:hypothetical protein HQQ92_23435 [Shewanella sp. DC2-4]|uniref:hypothetical protein n=1 Tax=Shewanella sp. DC2-4 TaxID=2739431 RepID=UPI0015668C9C|nr:hypothetical protein [Shewanella sp. DC2-4]NRD34672.1 hypothetical protein [Shewanella sp. DC2-4]
MGEVKSLVTYMVLSEIHPENQWLRQTNTRWYFYQREAKFRIPQSAQAERDTSHGAI